MNALRSHGAGWLPTIILALALLPLLLKVPTAAGFTGAILTYPFQVDDSEGVILSEAQWLARGVDPYQPARDDFFTAAPYTPIYTIINAAAFAVGSFTFKVGRGVAWLATLAVAAIIGALVLGRTHRPLLALWTILAILTTNLISIWSVRARPDHLALACNLAGFAIIWWRWRTLMATSGEATAARWRIDRAAWRIIWLTAICFALGFFTKQTLLAAPVAIGLGLLLARPRLGFAFGVIYGSLVLLPFAALTLITRGGFYQHIVAFHSSWSARDFLLLWGPFVARYWPPLLLGAGLPLTVLLTALKAPDKLAHLRADADLLPALYLPVAAFFALGAGTHGGNHNHFVETIVVALFCSALLIGRLLDLPKNTLNWRALTPTLLVALALVLGAEARFGGTNWLARDFRQPLPQEREGWRNVAAFVTNDPGPVYADNVGLLLVAGKEVRYTDPFSLAYATRTDQWDDRALVARVERGEFSLIALRYDLFATAADGGGPNDLTPGLYTAIRAHYRVIERNVMTLYVPR
ncbi:MAG: hypothetical protein AVDCRST_MAG18-3501 [uncultured Thermomicrobiales bacterium]|uniref:Glycosyltransferase RgtA/B/C/D-like domain-containing protein n=1 Tax=uncultured Thermomicrobiales bacterium TaxID=1645740 RepID=A0A6J4VSE6_9BACT|nr:MAG: hypothetical protein AVDCRST_MAG18-3501 [uncultured Thermomicrobiales bacterium]